MHVWQVCLIFAFSEHISYNLQGSMRYAEPTHLSRFESVNTASILHAWALLSKFNWSDRDHVGGHLQSWA